MCGGGKVMFELGIADIPTAGMIVAVLIFVIGVIYMMYFR
jgi:hypothetical protein